MKEIQMKIRYKLFRYVFQHVYVLIIVQHGFCCVPTYFGPRMSQVNGNLRWASIIYMFSFCSFLYVFFAALFLLRFSENIFIRFLPNYRPFVGLILVGNETAKEQRVIHASGKSSVLIENNSFSAQQSRFMDKPYKRPTIIVRVVIQQSYAIVIKYISSLSHYSFCNIKYRFDLRF